MPLPNTTRDPLRDWFPIAKVHEGRWSLLFRVRPASAASGAPADFVLRTLRAPARQGSFAHRRLSQELSAARAVQNPAILPVVDHDLLGAHPFTVTPFVQGFRLDRWQNSPQRCPLGYACWLARQTAMALSALHAAGFRHGAIEPKNLLVSDEGHVTLLDLTGAFMIGGLCPDGQLAINPLYAAPEQFFPGSQAQSASDIYSLGVLLFEWIARQPPYIASIPAEFEALHRLAPIPDLRAAVPDAPYYLAALLRRMLAKEPLRRPDAAEVAQLLSDIEITSFHDWSAVA